MYQSYNPSTLWRFLVRNVNGAPVSVNDRLTYRLHDWGGDPSAPLGYQTKDCVLSADRLSARQYESFSPWSGSYTDNPGNGGDIAVITSGGWAKIVATMDGSQPGVLYGFVGPGVGLPDDGRVGGWVICGPDVTVGAWRSAVCYLNESFNAGQPLNPSYTRYLIDTITVPFQAAGGSRSERNVEVLVSEHYNGADPTKSAGLERFLFGAGVGALRWEAWSTLPPGDELSQRAPPVSYGYPGSPSLNPNHHLVDVRHWANLVRSPPYVSGQPQVRGFRVSDSGWPQGLILS